MIASDSERNVQALQQEVLSLQTQTNNTPDWILQKNDIYLTNRELGRGGWATVKIGWFRGCAVAVKEIHELIYSEHNQRLFNREMTIASHCRHPCLLQVIY